MTREEIKKAMRDTKREIVIKNLHKLLSLVEGYPEYEDCISYALEELEQESETDILDKIRAEIEQVVAEENIEDSRWAAGLKYSLKIINKYSEVYIL